MDLSRKWLQRSILEQTEKLIAALNGVFKQFNDCLLMTLSMDKTVYVCVCVCVSTVQS